jgi:uncharacterized protein (DUF305 family)
MNVRWITAAGLAAALASTAPGIAAAQAQPAAQAPPHTEADVRFIHGMIGHHAQALEMTALVPARAARADVRLMAERIDVSQRSEIDRMEQWLRARGVAVPAADAHHAHGAHAQHGAGGEAAMPGMATPEEMARLAQATGAEFDQLFLELMIRHHEGALVMVEALFGSPGGGQDPEMYSIASEVDADQRMEIDRMRAMQQGPLGGARPR